MTVVFFLKKHLLTSTQVRITTISTTATVLGVSTALSVSSNQVAEIKIRPFGSSLNSGGGSDETRTGAEGGGPSLAF